MYNKVTALLVKYVGNLKAYFFNVLIKKSVKRKKYKNTWMSKWEVKVVKH
jgi:hypothetical protein